VDRETQIFEGDLFNFDSEVEPILQVIVGKTLEQALMEVLEEEELANMRAHQEEFDQIARAELAEAQRMEEAEKRRCVNVISGIKFMCFCIVCVCICMYLYVCSHVFVSV
jgi:hypothetical protein